MKMEEVCKELDEVKVEMEKVKAECRIKTESYESLKRVHNEQLIKFQESRLEVKRKDQELSAVSVELTEVKEMYEELKCSIVVKEKIVKELTNTNEKVRVSFGEKVHKLEGEKRELGLALEDAVARNEDLEQKVCQKNEENERLKRLLSDSEKKCFEAEQKVELFKEMRRREGVISRLEDELRDVKNKLKWKKEQFNHLEEAHEKLQKEFTSCKEEWEREKSTLIEKVSSLQSSLDSQTRISEGLQTQLKMCNQALAHEESRRKLLEVQLSESQSLFENVYAKCQEEQSKIEQLAAQRDEEIANLRNLLGTKGTLFKDMEFKVAHLELENKDLHGSLKELQEAQIKSAGTAPPQTKFCEKLRNLEQVRSSCNENLKEREIEWSSQIEKMKEDLSNYLSELQNKEIQIKELNEELETCRFSLEALNEEMGIVLMVMKSKFSEAYSELLVNSEKEYTEEALSMKEIKYVDLMEQENFLTMNSSLKSHKNMLKKSYETQHHQEEQVLHLENALKDISEALEKANSELVEKIHDKSLIETDMLIWKAAAESLKIFLEEKEEAHRQMETSLLAKLETEQTLRQEKQTILDIVKEQEMAISDLQQKIIELQTSIAAKTEALETFKQGKESYIQIAQEKDSRIDNLENKIAWLEHELMQRELEGAVLAQVEVDKSYEHEKERLLKVSKEKDNIIEDLQVKAILLEQEFISSAMTSISEVTEKQILIDMLTEALNSAMSLIKVEDQNTERNIAHLERVVDDLHHKLESQKESLFHAQGENEQLDHLLKVKEDNIKESRDQFNKEKLTMQEIIKELESNNRALLENIKRLSLEKDEILVHMEESCQLMKDICHEDSGLMGAFEKLFLEETEKEMEMTVSGKLCNSTKVTAVAPLSSTTKIVVGSRERSPLQEINN